MPDADHAGAAPQNPCPDPDVTGPIADIAALYPIGEDGVLCYEIGDDHRIECRFDSHVIQITRVLSEGTSGSDVSALQVRLQRFGLLSEVDGQFGPVTADAVKAFQSSNGCPRLVSPIVQPWRRSGSTCPPCPDARPIRRSALSTERTPLGVGGDRSRRARPQRPRRSATSWRPLPCGRSSRPTGMAMARRAVAAQALRSRRRRAVRGAHPRGRRAAPGRHRGADPRVERATTRPARRCWSRTASPRPCTRCVHRRRCRGRGAVRAATCDVHVKVDTGMQRVGAQPRRPPSSPTSRADAALRVAAVFTHLACADDPDVAGERRPTRRLRRVLAELDDRAAAAACTPPTRPARSPIRRVASTWCAPDRDLRHLARARRRPPPRDLRPVLSLRARVSLREARPPATSRTDGGTRSTGDHGGHRTDRLRRRRPRRLGTLSDRPGTDVLIGGAAARSWAS